MSDFLQFVDRIPTLPNRKKLTFENDASVKYATVEYADEPAEEGTFLNKANFNRLNAVLGYNATTSTIEEIISEEKEYTGNLYPNSISPTFTTATPIDVIKENMISFDGIIPTISYSGSQYLVPQNQVSTSNINFYSVIAGSKYYNYTNFLNNCTNLSYNPNTYNYFNLTKQYINLTIDFDFKCLCKPTFNYRMDVNMLTTIKSIKASNDNINWVDLEQISTGTNVVYTSNEFYRYYRFYFEKGSSNNGSEIDIYYLYVSNVIYKKIIHNNKIETNYNINYVDNQIILIETPDFNAQNIDSNTINGINCNTLLSPLKKYELIYKENLNEFLIGKLIDNTLFDITLTQAVNQVDLTGISDKLQLGKLYSLIIVGGVSADDQIYFGDTQATYSTSTGVYQGLALFKLNIKNDYTKYIEIIGAKNNSYSTGRSQITNNEYIKCKTTTTTFKAGTRIIIKEVA